MWRLGKAFNIRELLPEEYFIVKKKITLDLPSSKGRNIQYQREWRKTRIL